MEFLVLCILGELVWLGWDLHSKVFGPFGFIEKSLGRLESIEKHLQEIQKNTTKYEAN